MMKSRKNMKMAAMLLAVVMLLGLAACGGQEASLTSEDLHGNWASNDRCLIFPTDFDGAAVMYYIDQPDVFYGYNYTIDGNVLKMENTDTWEDENAMEAPETMELTFDADQLVSGDMVFTKVPADSDSAAD